MNRKIVETLLRHKLLLLLPPLLAVAIVTPLAFVVSPAYYETTTSIWVERPGYLNANDNWNKYVPPAQNQRTRLKELLETRSFQRDVASRTSLAEQAQNASDDWLARNVGDAFELDPKDNNLLVIHQRAVTPQLSYELANALIDSFQARFAQDQARVSDTAVTFYDDQLQAAQRQLDQAVDAVRQYAQSHPGLASSIANDPLRGVQGLPQSTTNPELTDLLRQVDTQQAAISKTLGLVEQAKLDSVASKQAAALAFQVADPPRAPTGPSASEVRKRFIYPFAALALGAVVSAVLLGLLAASDRTVHSADDIRPTVPVLGSVPPLGARDPGGRSQHPDGTRVALARAISGREMPAPTGRMGWLRQRNGRASQSADHSNHSKGAA